MHGIDFVQQVIQRSGGKFPSLPEFSEALVGFQNSANKPLRPVYDFDRCIDLLVEQGMSEQDAITEVVKKLEAFPELCMVTLVRDAFEEVEEGSEEVGIEDTWRTFSGSSSDTEEFTFTFSEEDPETEKLK